MVSGCKLYKLEEVTKAEIMTDEEMKENMKEFRKIGRMLFFAIIILIVAYFTGGFRFMP